ncbi:hypothetical protein Tco_0356012 [Tanacetum coccineum]
MRTKFSIQAYSFISDHSSDRDLLFFLEPTVTKTLLSFSSKNEDKVFNPKILILKGVHPLSLRIPHRSFDAFKVLNVYRNVFESLMKIFPFFRFYYGGDVSSLDVKRIENKAKTRIFGFDSIKFTNYSRTRQSQKNSPSISLERARDFESNVIIEYLVKVSKWRAFWSLNEDILKITILKTNTPYLSRKIRRIRASTHRRPQRNEDQYAVSRRSHYTLRMTKVIKGEFEKLEDLKVKDVSLTYDTSLEVFKKEFNQLSGNDDDSKQRMSHEANDDMGYDPSNIRGDNEVELTNEEFSDNEDEVAEIYEWNKDIPWVDEKPWTEVRVWTDHKPVKHTCKPFNYKTGCSEWPTCSWRENGYCNGGNFPEAYLIRNSLHYQDLEWYMDLEYSKLKDEALLNKAIMEGLISDDESSNDCWKRWKSHEIMMKGNMKTKLITKDVSSVVSNLARCRFAK